MYPVSHIEERNCREICSVRWPNSARLSIVVFPGLPNSRWVALRLLDGDARIASAIRHGEFGEQDDGRPAVVAADKVRKTTHSANGAGEVLSRASALRWKVGLDFHERLVETIYAEAARDRGCVYYA